ncbi:MAG: hypothetical protein LBL32_02630 [Holosporales bacterium]|nr:hypothetical protein [Holosporales bacterium]
MNKISVFSVVLSLLTGFAFADGGESRDESSTAESAGSVATEDSEQAESSTKDRKKKLRKNCKSKKVNNRAAKVTDDLNKAQVGPSSEKVDAE